MGMRFKKKSFHHQVADHEADHNVENFTALIWCVVYGLQNRAIHGMLDFDFMCKREHCLFWPIIISRYVIGKWIKKLDMVGLNKFLSILNSKFYWGTDEILIPVYQSMKDAFDKHSDFSGVLNFTSFCSIYKPVMEMLEFLNQIKTIAWVLRSLDRKDATHIVSYHPCCGLCIPGLLQESQPCAFNVVAQMRDVRIIGPATVGGIKVGVFNLISELFDANQGLNTLPFIYSPAAFRLETPPVC